MGTMPEITRGGRGGLLKKKKWEKIHRKVNQYTDASIIK